MSDFPSIENPSDKYFQQYPQKGQDRTEFEAGYVHSRATATSMRWVFILGWGSLKNSDFTSLYQHFENNIGGTFNWTHPLTAAVHVVRYTNDKLPPARPNGFVDGEQAWDLSGLQLEER